MSAIVLIVIPVSSPSSSEKDNSRISSKSTSESYSAGWERIFGSKSSQTNQSN